MRRIEVMHALITAVIAPLAGIALGAYLALQGALESWHAGFILGLMFGPAILSDKMGAMWKRIERVSRAMGAEDEPPLPPQPPAPEAEAP